MSDTRRYGHKQVWGLLLMIILATFSTRTFAAATFNPIQINTIGNPFGYWEYLPSSYYTSTKPLPLVIFFHGAGEVGNGQLPGMNVILKLGPPLIANDATHPLHNIFDQNEVIMLAPQCPDNNGAFTFWFSQWVNQYITWAKDHYGNRIDLNRVYLTGLSMGSGGIHLLMNDVPNEASKAAAILVTASVGGADDIGAAAVANVPYWCLTAYGDSPAATIDGMNRVAGKIAGTGPTNVMATYPGSDIIRTATFSPSTGWTWTEGSNGVSGVTPKLTLYPGSAHWSWGPTYDNPDCWTWMFAQRKSAGPDTIAPGISLNTPTTGSSWITYSNTLNLTGSASDNVGVTQVSWTNDRGGNGVATGTNLWAINDIPLQNGINQITVTAQDGANNRTSKTLTVNAGLNNGSNGLKAEYFNSTTLTGLAFTRVDAAVGFDWGLGGPGGGLGTDNFSVRWTGSVVPRYTQTYTFSTISDDGVRLWVNGQLLIDNWTNHGAIENSGMIFLQAGIRYDIKIEYYDNAASAVAELFWSSANQAKEIIPPSQLFPPGQTSGAGTGLIADYFNTVNLTGTSLNRIDSSVNFDWASGSPDPTLNVDNFSARWTGKILPRYSETYTFYTLSDDGVRLWINGQLIIDNWTAHPASENAGTISLQAGQKYDIKMEYFENTGAAVAKLLWSSASQAKEIIPQSQLFPELGGLNAEYFSSGNLTGRVLVRTDSAINFDWGSGSPDASMSADSFSVRWVGKIVPRFSETYTLYTQTDDGVRLWINGNLIIDNWTLHPITENSATIALQAGQKYDLKMEYCENTGLAVAKFLWSSASQPKEIVPTSQLIPTGTGLNAQYYNNVSFSGTPLERIDSTVNFDWGNGSPDTSIPADNYCARWSGKVLPLYSETYTFSTQSDDGVRLWVNGTLVIDNWTQHGVMENTGNITLQAGRKYDIKMEWFEASGQAVAKLLWQSQSQSKEIIPQSQLFALSSSVVQGNTLTRNSAPSSLQLQTVDISGATVSVSDPAVGDTIAFTAPAVSGSNIAYTWDFGDGTSADGANATHAYAAEGTYTATVTMTDSEGDTVTSSITVNVGSALPIKIKKAQISLAFNAAGHDSITVSGILTVGKDFTVTGKKIEVDFGGVAATFVMNDKGAGRAANSALKLKTMHGNAGEALFQIRWAKGTFGNELADEGLVNSDINREAKNIGLKISIDGAKYSTAIKTLYASKANKNGRAKY